MLIPISVLIYCVAGGIKVCACGADTQQNMYHDHVYKL